MSATNSRDIIWIRVCAGVAYLGYQSRAKIVLNNTSFGIH